MAIRVYRKNRPNVILLVFSKVLFVAGLTFEPENVGEIEKKRRQRKYVTYIEKNDRPNLYSSVSMLQPGAMKKNKT